MRRALMLLIVSLLAVTVFTGCVGDDDSKQDNESINTMQESRTVSQNNNILLSSLGNYSVVRSEEADSAEIDAAKLVYGAIKEKFNADVTIKTDFIKAGDAKYSAGEYEILIGQTNRTESDGFISVMRTDDYGYGLIGKKLVITGTDAADTYLAAEKFVREVIGNRPEDTDVFYAAESDFMFTGSYNVDSLTLDGTAINEYGIVYKYNGGMGEELLAVKLQSAVTAASGYILNVYSDKEEAREHEILIGVTSRESGSAYSEKLDTAEYYIGKHGGNIILWAGGADGITAAVSTLADRINAACTASKAAVLTTGDREILTSSGSKLSVMSFNVLVSNITAERAERVIDMVSNYLPDTIGFQEASPTWMTKLNASLSKYYSYVGNGRDGGSSGEYNPVFYRKDKFTLIESGTKWLSDTPDKVSKYSESSLNRIFTYAVLKRNSDGKTFVHINTHLEHTSSDARVKQAAVLVKFIEKYSGYPVLLTGDFNCTSGTDEYKLIDETYLSSSANTALKKENAGATFHNFGSSDKIIDFIFISDKNILISLYKVAIEKINGDYASDHHPVYAEYSIIN